MPSNIQYHDEQLECPACGEIHMDDVADLLAFAGKKTTTTTCEYCDASILIVSQGDIPESYEVIACDPLDDDFPYEYNEETGEWE